MKTWNQIKIENLQFDASGIRNPEDYFWDLVPNSIVNVYYPISNVEELSYSNLILQKQKEFKEDPYSFWAKKFDEEIHIVDDNSTQTGGNICCGKYGALLGNNYVIEKQDKPLCESCLLKFHMNFILERIKQVTSVEEWNIVRSYLLDQSEKFKLDQSGLIVSVLGKSK